MNRIDKTFKKSKKILSVYFSAGYPRIGDTIPILKKLQESGVDMIEIGLPFSDPKAATKTSACFEKYFKSFVPL